jgi:NAD(P)H-flavin reductase
MTLVTIAPDVPIARSYVSPGQYVDVRIDGATGYFVLAGLPGASPWRLLMKAGGGASDVLLDAPLGRTLEVTSAIGDGFPMAAMRARPVVLALGGTGIAAGPPIVARRVEDGDALRTEVYVGAKTQADLALEGEMGRWRAAGVSVVVCLSQAGTSLAPDADAPVARPSLYARGYVQDVIRARVTAGQWNDVHVLAVGVASMVEALRALPRELGLTPERVLTNH